MSERRVFPRKRRRLLVSFELAGAPCSGFTCDLGHTGIFIATTRLPHVGEEISAEIEAPGGKKVKCRGTVVRARKNPSSLSFTEATGFSLKLAGYSEEYFNLVESLG
ncbi:MAG: PilZ domain-containing protein [Acidobacteria bacterium]|nr:MAG: PilZ domain-containing protein [Acidobacteriota bacterium]MCE7956686.1 PilZ domain-containing protein [Acidobacteria bacterium ACB2]